MKAMEISTVRNIHGRDMDPAKGVVETSAFPPSSSDEPAFSPSQASTGISSHVAASALDDPKDTSNTADDRHTMYSESKARVEHSRPQKTESRKATKRPKPQKPEP